MEEKPENLRKNKQMDLRKTSLFTIGNSYLERRDSQTFNGFNFDRHESINFEIPLVERRDSKYFEVPMTGRKDSVLSESNPFLNFVVSPKNEIVEEIVNQFDLTVENSQTLRKTRKFCFSEADSYHSS